MQTKRSKIVFKKMSVAICTSFSTVDSTYFGYSQTAHNVHVFVTGGREPVILRSLFRPLSDIATQID